MRRTLTGAIAGVVGTCVEALFSAIEERTRGRPPVYDPGLMADRLARGLLGVELDGRKRRAVTWLVRWPYGACWGAALAAVLPAPGRWPVSGLALGAAVSGFELVALPLIGATPTPDHWSRDEMIANGVNTMAFGLVTAGTFRALGARDG